jgi:hypothetical protein
MYKLLNPSHIEGFFYNPPILLKKVNFGEL